MDEKKKYLDVSNVRENYRTYFVIQREKITVEKYFVNSIQRRVRKTTICKTVYLLKIFIVKNFHFYVLVHSVEITEIHFPQLVHREKFTEHDAVILF